MFCNNCGKKLMNGTKFCSFCGERVKLEKTPQYSNHTSKKNYSTIVDGVFIAIYCIIMFIVAVLFGILIQQTVKRIDVIYEVFEEKGAHSIILVCGMFVFIVIECIIGSLIFASKRTPLFMAISGGVFVVESRILMSVDGISKGEVFSMFFNSNIYWVFLFLQFMGFLLAIAAGIMSVMKKKEKGDMN